MFLLCHWSTALAGEQEDENGSKTHKLLRIAKVLGETATPNQQWWKSEIDFDEKQPFHSFLKAVFGNIQRMFTSIWSPRLVYEQSLFWCIYLVLSDSFQTELFLTVVPAVCNKTCCIALLPFPRLQENNRLSRYGFVFTIATDKQLLKNKRCPYQNSAACRNVRNLEHNEVQGIMTFYLLGVLSLAKCYRSVNAEWDPPVHSPREKWVVLVPERWAPAGLGWTLMVASGHPNWKGVRCRGAQKLKARGQVVTHIDSCHAMLACSPDEMARPGTSSVAVQTRAVKEPE